MRTRPYAVCAHTQAMVSLTTFLSPSTCRPTNDARLRQKSAGNRLGTERWTQGTASWGKGQGWKWREGERKTAQAHAGGPACPQGGSSALGVALQQGQPNTPCSPLPGRGHRRSGSRGSQTQRSTCFTWHSPSHPLMLCVAFAETAAVTEAAHAPQAGNVYWAFHRKHLPALAPDTLQALLGECGALPQFLGS